MSIRVPILLPALATSAAVAGLAGGAAMLPVPPDWRLQPDASGAYPCSFRRALWMDASCAQVRQRHADGAVASTCMLENMSEKAMQEIGEASARSLRGWVETKVGKVLIGDEMPYDPLDISDMLLSRAARTLARHCQLPGEPADAGLLGARAARGPGGSYTWQVFQKSDDVAVAFIAMWRLYKGVENSPAYRRGYDQVLSERFKALDRKRREQDDWALKAQVPR